MRTSLSARVGAHGFLSLGCSAGDFSAFDERGVIALSRPRGDMGDEGAGAFAGASSVLSGCHIHGNGYSNNDDDLGSGVTVYGASSVVRVGTTMHLFFLTAKYSILSFLFLSVLFP